MTHNSSYHKNKRIISIFYSTQAKKWQKICNIIWYDIKQSIPFKISLQPTNQTNNTHLKPKSFWFTVLDVVIEYEFNVGIFIETSIHLFTEYVSA